MKQRKINLLVHERYKNTTSIWHNLLRFWSQPSSSGQALPPEWAIVSNFYHGVRREYGAEIEVILNSGGDAYSRLAKVRELVAN